MFFLPQAKRKTSGKDYKGGFSLWRPPVAGVDVNDQTAFTYSAFFACVRIISESIAYLPWHVMVGGTKRKVARDHYLDALLFSRPNEELNSFYFRELLLQHCLAWGNHYSEIERSRSGKIVNLWPLDPSRVIPERDSKGKLYYQVLNNGAPNSDLATRDVFHVRGPSRDGINGYSVIDLARESISLGLAVQTFGASFFGNGAIPGTVIMNEGTAELDEVGIKNLKASFNRSNRGARNAHRTEYLSPGLKLDVIGMPPDSAQFLQSRKFEVTEMCRWFRIQPHKLADLERSTHTNIEAQNIEHVTDTLMPWVSRIESQSNFSLIENQSKYYNKINVNGILRGDSKARAEYYKTLMNLGVLSIDEIRDKEDMDSIGENGDLRLVPLNMTTPERMKSGEGIKSANPHVNAVFLQTAQRFSKIEINRTKKLAEKADREGIANFYIEHGRALADGFSSIANVLCSLLGREKVNVDGVLATFFGDYISKSADELQNSIESSRLNELFCSWEARKAENMKRDLIDFIYNRAGIHA